MRDVNDSRGTNDYAERLAALEARVSRLERSGAPSAPPDPGVGAGTIGYGGAVELDGTIRWKIDYSAESALALDTGSISDVLAALGNPTRIEIVRTLLRGPATATELQEATALSSTGRLYHHLRTLSAARIVEQESRNRYRVAAPKVVPLLVAMVAAGDLAEQL